MTIQNEKKLKENIQKNILFYRKMRKVTQKQLADFLDIGVSTVSIQKQSTLDFLALKCRLSITRVVRPCFYMFS